MTGSSPIRSSSSAAPSARRRARRTALFSDLSLGGQVNLLTTGAFDNPLQLLQLDRTSSVAFFSVGAPVGSHGDWTVRAAMNQSDLSSWMLAGSYVVKAPVAASISVRHVVQPAALRGRQHRRARRRLRHRAQRRVGVRLRRVAGLALRRRRLRRQLRALRLHGRPGAVQPALSARRSRRPKSWRIRASASRDSQRAGRGRIHSADRPRSTCRRSARSRRSRRRAFATQEHAELRGRRRARAERRDDRRARIRAAHRQSDRDRVRPAARDATPRRSAITTSARPATRACAASASRSRTRSRRTFAARSIIRSRPPTGRSSGAG